MTKTKMKRRIQKRSRSFVFTLNNPTEDFKKYFTDIEVEWKKDRSLSQDPLPFRYGCGQLEQGADTGTVHIQGYFELNTRVAFSTLKKHLPGAPHIESRRGTPSQAIEYTLKEDTRHESGWRFEFGESKGQGFRSDLSGVADRVAEEVLQGNTMEEIMDAHPGYYMEKKDKIRSFRAEVKALPVRMDKKFIIMIGPTGSGKTASVGVHFKDHHDLIIPHGKGPLWWDGYSGEDTVLIDEFGKGRVPYTTIKRLIDYKSHTYNVKHSSCVANPKNVIVTTTHHPKTWYSGVKDKNEFRRRIREMGELWQFTGAGSYPNFECVKSDMKDFEFDPYEEEYNFQK